MAAGTLGLCIVVVVAVLGVTTVVNAGDKKQKIKVLNVIPCDDYQPNSFTGIKFSPAKKGNFHMSAQLNLGETYTVDNASIAGKLVKCWKVADMYECEDKGIDSKYDDYCDHVNEDGYPWSCINQNIKNNPDKCTIHGKEEATMDDATCNLDFLQDQDLSGSDYWSYRFASTRDGSNYACVQYYFKVSK